MRFMADKAFCKGKVFACLAFGKEGLDKPARRSGRAWLLPALVATSFAEAGSKAIERRKLMLPGAALSAP